MFDIRNKNGDPYLPSTLYQLCCGLLWQIRIINPSWNIFDDPEFTDFQNCLDGIMKQLKADRLMNERAWILFAVIRHATIPIFHPVDPNSHSPSSIRLSDQRNRGSKCTSKTPHELLMKCLSHINTPPQQSKHPHIMVHTCIIL